MRIASLNHFVCLSLELQLYTCEGVKREDIEYHHLKQKSLYVVENSTGKY